MTQDDLDRLLKLRVIVARFGEMDMAKWRNTNGQLGRLGSATVRRGLPRTHHFAQARSVFAVAAHRCSEVYEAPRSVTLWTLPQSIERAFDARWETWLDDAGDWASFFEDVENLDGSDLAGALRAAGLTTDEHPAAVGRLRRSAEGRAVQIPGEFSGSIDDVITLGLAFSLGEPGALAVPFQSAGASA